MAKKSSIKTLPPEILAEINRLLAEDLATLDEIVERLQDMGHPRSRSALSRHKLKLDKVAENLRRSREMASALVREIGPDAAEGKVGRLLVEILQNLVFDHLLKASEGGGEAALGTGDFFYLAKAIKDLTAAAKIDMERELKIRQEAAAKAADQMCKAAEKLGLKKETIDSIRSNILGLVD